MQRHPFVNLFFCGDVMLGRGIDQVMPFPLPPGLHEDGVHDALDYVKLAEELNGPIPRPVDFEYIWGDALHWLQGENPDVRIINLETAVTRNPTWSSKGIHYRMNPYNAPCLSTAQIDVAVLANNHVLDWKANGLLETLAVVRNENIKTVGAGANQSESERPAEIQLPQGIVLQVFAFALRSGGVPQEWASAEHRAGVNFLEDLSSASCQRVRDLLWAHKKPNAVVVLSLHWGANWGYEISEEERNFAHGLIDEGLVDVIYGHSCHHPKAVEVYKEKLILYGCGDFINDYEGIRGHEKYRPDLVLMYFVKLDVQSQNLVELRLVPLRLRNFHLSQPQPQDVQWLRGVLAREYQKFNGRIRFQERRNLFELEWIDEGVSASLEVRDFH